MDEAHPSSESTSEQDQRRKYDPHRAAHSLTVVPDEGPTTALRRALRGLPTEAAVSSRGLNLVDAIRYLCPDDWKEYRDFIAKKQAGDLKGESWSLGWQILLDAWAKLVDALRSERLAATAFREGGGPTPIPIPPDAWLLCEVKNLWELSASSACINGQILHDVRVHPGAEQLSAIVQSWREAAGGKEKTQPKGGRPRLTDDVDAEFHRRRARGIPRTTISAEAEEIRKACRAESGVWPCKPDTARKRVGQLWRKPSSVGET